MLLAVLAAAALMLLVNDTTNAADIIPVDAVVCGRMYEGIGALLASDAPWLWLGAAAVPLLAHHPQVQSKSPEPRPAPYARSLLYALAPVSWRRSSSSAARNRLVVDDHVQTCPNERDPIR